MSTIAEKEAVGTLSFHQALMQAEAQARSTLDPALHERLSAAVALVTDGRVFQTSTGEWQVDSSSQEGLTYSVNGVCSCDDHHYNKPPKGLCKHRIAMFLSQRVVTLMHQPQEEPVVPEVVEPWGDNDHELELDPTGPAPAVSPVSAVPEMPFSVTLKGTIDGQDALLTARGLTAAEFKANLAAIRGLLDPVPAKAAPKEEGEGAPQCPHHGLKRRGKHGWFCPRKMQDGSWCTGGVR